MAASTKEVLTDLSPIIKLYTDGTVDRLHPSPQVPPSPEDPTTGVSTKDVTISPSISARLHLPKLAHPSQTLPILVYYHGGGFCIGTEIDFQKEEWISNHADFSRIYIGGDSAGGNIAHNVAMRAGSDPLPGNVKIIGAILSHPQFSGSNRIGIEENRGEDLIHRLWNLAYPSADGGIANPSINPFVDGAPSLSGLGCCKIMVCLAEKDFLTARGRFYAAEVRKSGWRGEVEVVEIEGEDHCFHYFDPHTEKAQSLINRMAAFISR